MILLSTDPREPAARQKFIDVLGSDDAEVLVQWVYENQGRNSVSYGQALAHIAAEIDVHGPGFAHNLLDAAKKPRHVWEAERELIAWATPRIEAACNVVRGHRGDADVAKKEFDQLCYGLEEKLWNMFPHKHRATMKGAIIGSFQHKGGSMALNVAMLVKALNLDDPLAATAAQSR